LKPTNHSLMDSPFSIVELPDEMGGESVKEPVSRPSLRAYHDSHDERYREPFGARPCDGQVTLRLMVGSQEPLKECSLCVLSERTGREEVHPMQAVRHKDLSLKGTTGGKPLVAGTVFEKTLKLPREPGLIWYYFRLETRDTTYYYHNNPQRLGGEGVLCPLTDREVSPGPHDPPVPGCPPYQITVYKPSVVPEWFKSGVMYQIFVDRFFNGYPGGKILNPKKKSLVHTHWDDTPFYIRDEKGRVKRWDFFGGNLQGVIAKLPYLEELGVSVLYLNPIFEAASNHKYDTGDYLKIDPMYGDLETFIRLADEAKRRGISIILDGVFSHTGADSLYFNRYGHYPGLGAFQAEVSPYYPWYRLECPGGPYECWWGEEDLPNVNELEPSYLEFILGKENGVARYWLRKGARGWRLDVADELPDEFIRRLRKAVKETDPEAVLIGEVWEDASNKISYGERREYFLGEELDSVMNYPLRDVLLKYMLGRESARDAALRIMSLYENYPQENFRATMNLLGSHDRIRILTLLGDAPPERSLTATEREEYRLSAPARERAVRRLKLMVLLQMTLPGVPCVYYGDEAGMEGYSDPYNRGTYPWGREDREILEWHKQMIWLRREYDVLRKGEFKPFCIGDDVLGFRTRSIRQTHRGHSRRSRQSGEDEETRTRAHENPAQCGESDTQAQESSAQHEKRGRRTSPGSRAEDRDSRPCPGYEQIIVCVNRDRFERKEFSLDIGEQATGPRAPGGGLAPGTVLSGPCVLELLSGERVLPDESGRGIRCSLGPLEGKVYYIFKPQPESSRPSSLAPPQCARRSSGILLHLTSLPSRWGIGDMGEEARRFVKFLSSAGQTLWQVLPLNPVGHGNSPYSGPSLMAGNPLLISPDLLLKEGLLTREDISPELERLRQAGVKGGRVDYPLVAEVKERLFRKAWERFRKRDSAQQRLQAGDSRDASFRAFIRENKTWLDDYCLFMALKNRMNGLPWVDWDGPLAKRTPRALEKMRAELSQEIEYQRFLQYVFQHEWLSLKDYANRRGIRIVGDMPIYADADSCDTWAHRSLFKLDSTGRPVGMAGVPPDYFSATGQLWGNPVYNWREMEKDGYAWWKSRIRRMLDLYDYVRIDHFRGFAGFWEVPAGETTAEKGRWMKGPGKRFFESLRAEFGDLPFIAEDLGYITPDVRNLKNILGFPGMKIFQFEEWPLQWPTYLEREIDPGHGGAEPDGEPRDEPHGEEWVYYSGTHDNDTLIGWCSGMSGLGETDVKDLTPLEKKTLARRILRRIYLSKAKWVIIPFQDLLGLGSEARMNTPGTSEGNWEWRMKAEDLEPETFDPDGESRKPDANKDGVKPEGYRPLLDWLRECTVESARAPARDAARSPGRSSGV
jgi:4-alpha-glucanotransferase/glycosidase